jgi:branched-chain amino acid transport system permease protein
MADLLQLLIGGLSTGAIYALVAVGFALLWQASQTINFGQGEFVMLPAFFVLAAMRFGHLPLWAAILVGAAVSVLVLGVLFKRLLVDPILPHGVMPLVIATIAFATILKESVKEFYGAETQAFPNYLPQTMLHFGGAVVSMQDILVLAVAIAAVTGLQLFLARTRIGRCMQATAQNPTVARILGIPVERMILLTFVINAVLVTLASVLTSPIYLPKFSNGELLGTYAFIAAIVGGFNQVKGAIVGGLLLGVADNLMATYVSTQYRAVVPLLLLILVILFRPQGLLGRAEERTV